MDANEQDWSEILKFFEPRPPLYSPEKMSITQKAFLRYEGLEALFGGMAGGGKSSALLMAALQYVDVPGYAAMLFRRSFSDLVLPGALVDRFKDWIAPYDEIKWNGAEYKATFPSGATIGFGYLNNENDHLRYKGSELQFVGMDEVSEIRQNHYTYMFSRMRRPPNGPLSRVPLRMRSTSNPAPNWVRQYFIVEGEKYNRIFVPSRMDDNPGVDVAAYRMSLSKLDPVERKRLEDGDWWATSGGSMFKRGDFQIISHMELPPITDDSKIVRFWDLAATEQAFNEDGQSVNDPDWTVGTLGMFHEGKFYVLDVVRDRLGPSGVEKLVVQTAMEDGPGVPIRMEQEPGSAGKITADNYARKVLPGYDFRALSPIGDKVTRARPYASAVANHNVHVVRSHWLTQWIDEHASFPEACDHDDQVDSAVGAFNHVSGFGEKMKRKARIII